VVLVFLPTIPAFAQESPEPSGASADASSQETAQSDPESVAPDVLHDEAAETIPERVTSEPEAENQIESSVPPETESDQETDQSDIEPVSGPTDIAVPEVQTETEVSADLIETQAEPAPDPVEDAAALKEATEIENAEFDTASATQPTVLEEATTTEDMATSSETVMDTPELQEESQEISEEEPLEEGMAGNDVEEIASTTEEISGPIQEIVNVVTTDENKFSFSKDECVIVADGMFYCTQATTSPAVIENDRIFAAADGEGDKEIYAEHDSKIVGLTDNAFDDDAPYYDEISDTIVWHRLLDGRYQIISYDLETESEEQLTFDRFNNMQPSRYDDTTVWQGWVGEDWEIFMLKDDELHMLTDNTTHDIAPSINGTHVVWQAFENNAWRMKVYDLKTELIDTIEDSEGGSIQNPRFVLVYDTKNETGDVETRGYDLKSGEVVPLGAEPAPMPKNIPDPDQTGEERALVQVTTQVKPKTEETDDIGNGQDGTETGTSIESLVMPGDVVVPIFSEATSTDAHLEEVTDLQPHNEEITDVVISSATSTEHIEDLIIAPFVEPIDGE
jgi:hypothetical protein